MTKMIRVGIEDECRYCYSEPYNVFELASHIPECDCLRVEEYKFDEWKDLRKRLDVLEQYFDSLETDNNKKRREEREEFIKKSKEAYERVQAKLPQTFVQFRKPKDF